MKTDYCSIIPHDEISGSFLKYFERMLSNSGFEKSFEHRDPGGVDVYRYQNSKAQIIVVTCTQLQADKDELKISSEWSDLKGLVEKAADSFGDEIARMIKKGRKD